MSIIMIVIIQFNTIKFYLLCTLILSIIIIVITVVIIITQYSKFQFKICFNRVIGFLKKSAF